MPGAKLSRVAEVQSLRSIQEGAATVPKYDFENEETAQRIIREFGMEQGKRGVWESHWQEIAERIWPGMSWKFNPYWYTTPGAKKNQFVYDSTATLSLNKFAAILDSLLTPRSNTWHSLCAVDAKLNKRSDVRSWFDTATRQLFHYRYLGSANFSSQNHFNFKSLGGFGSGCLFTDRLYGQKGLRYRAIGLGEIYYVENHQGIVDKSYRYFDMTIRQAIQRWGESVPENMKALAEKDPEMIFHFIHCVEPRGEDYDPERKDHKGMKWASYYVCREETKVVEEGGYKTYPYAISRYDQYPGEVYGRSPAMDLLPAIKTLNEEKRTMLKQGHRVVDPVLIGPDDGVLDGFSLRPGAYNTGGVNAQGQPLVHALPTGNLQIGKELMDDERELIKDGFLVSLFQILTENPQMTATEVLERAKEKGILLAPTIGRQQSEYLSPLIERELDLLMQQNLLPPMPEALLQQEGEYKIVYDSPLNRDQRAEEGAGLMRTVENALQVAQVTQNPEILDHFNWDIIVPEMAEIQGVPFHWMMSKEQIAKNRQVRQQQAQAQTAIQAAPGAAAMINAGAKAKTAVNGS